MYWTIRLTARPAVETPLAIPKTMLLFAASSVVASNAIDPSTRPLSTEAACLYPSIQFELYVIVSIKFDSGASVPTL
jgi:hypothetical protein